MPMVLNLSSINIFSIIVLIFFLNIQIANLEPNKFLVVVGTSDACVLDIFSIPGNVYTGMLENLGRLSLMRYLSSTL